MYKYIIHLSVFAVRFVTYERLAGVVDCKLHHQGSGNSPQLSSINLILMNMICVRLGRGHKSLEKNELCV